MTDEEIRDHLKNTVDTGTTMVEIARATDIGYDSLRRMINKGCRLQHSSRRKLIAYLEKVKNDSKN